MLQKAFSGYKRVLKEGSLDLLYGLTMKGIESFLILYLTSSLLYSDDEAFDFLGAKNVIYYSIAFLMSLLSRKLLSVQGSILTGFLMMGLGCFLVSLKGFLFLALGMGFLTCGYGVGRPAIPLMISEKKDADSRQKHKDAGYLYAFGNLASILSPILLALLGHFTNWRTVFISLSGVCLVGALCFYISLHKKHLISRFSLKKVIVVGVSPFLLSLIIYFQDLKWILTGGTALGAIIYLKRFYQTATLHTRLILMRLSLLGPSIILFFTLQSQEYF
tara:strand:+ start:1292 stop:2116 length:825 start_codon:yes stop_codon:yes gene_type:complete